MRHIYIFFLTLLFFFFFGILSRYLYSSEIEICCNIFDLQTEIYSWMAQVTYIQTKSYEIWQVVSISLSKYIDMIWNQYDKDSMII